ncbi:MAG TPA: ASKHA domain-containing protein [Candidatus Saccharimonadales bacterium]|nr:ASKHA domain-containing protein [Candidatus Saccharimonadales bacterium]
MNATVQFIPHGIAVPVATGTRLIDAARAAGIRVETPCDGAGTCGKCKAKINQGALHPRGEEHEGLTQTEREAGWVLACQAVIQGDLQVEMASTSNDGLRIISEGQSLTVELDPWIRKSFDAAAGITRVLAGDSVIATEPGDTTGRLFGMAIDIGTTTLVSTLLDLCTGQELGLTSSLNPQARHAQDVLSRIKLGSKSEGLRKLHGELIEELSRHAAYLAAKAGIAVAEIYEAIFSGNTTMLHLATATDPSSLGKFPYHLNLQGGTHVPAREIDLRISEHGVVYLPPIMSAYVGPDITSGILSADLANQSGTTLLVDIGTNGEIVLSVDGQLTATSTAAGPAFEGMNIVCGMRASRGAVELVQLGDDGVRVETIAGAEPVGICGSGLLDVVGELASQGGLDKNGRFLNNGASHDKPWRDQWETVDGRPAFRIAGPVYLTQKDVRQVQLAKGAIRTGIDMLLKANHLDASQVDRVLIAGSFGFHLRTSNLIHLGLLPSGFGDRVEFVGNTSKSGAQAFLLNWHTREKMKDIVAEVNILELANDPAFEKAFVKSLQF